MPVATGARGPKTVNRLTLERARNMKMKITYAGEGAPIKLVEDYQLYRHIAAVLIYSLNYDLIDPSSSSSKSWTFHFNPYANHKATVNSNGSIKISNVSTQTTMTLDNEEVSLLLDMSGAVDDPDLRSGDSYWRLLSCSNLPDIAVYADYYTLEIHD